MSAMEQGNLSQQTDYGPDISGLILDFKEGPEIHPPHSSSLRSLGKRKASYDSSLMSIGSCVNRPKKNSSGIYMSSFPPCGSDNFAPGSIISPDPNSPYIIAHSPSLQRIISELDLPTGVRFEIARFISLGHITYEQIDKACLTALVGTNAKNVEHTAQVVLGVGKVGKMFDPAFANEAAATSPWEELDIEERALAESPYSGLGNNPAFPGWYGGKISFRGKLVRSPDSSCPYKIQLNKPTLGPSTRLTRRFGSSSLLRIKIPAGILYAAHNGLIDFFRRPILILGWTYMSFWAKEDVVFCIQVRGVGVWVAPEGKEREREENRMSLWEFLDWHNPLRYNVDQTMAKWAARFALALSNSYPGPKLAQEDINEEPDIISPQGSDMTDGCGLGNKPLHISLYCDLVCEVFPTAIQFRLAGYKGMILLRIEPNSTLADIRHKVYLRPSQLKIRYPPTPPIDQTSMNTSAPGVSYPDPAHLTLDVLRTSRFRTPARLSPETIINLAENGVPHGVFVALLCESVAEVIRTLTSWEGPDAMYELWAAVERVGGVCSSRRAREAMGEARVRGLNAGADEEAESEEDEQDEDGLGGYGKVGQRSAAWWTDQTSGCPSSLEETVMVLLDAGFKPQASGILSTKLKQVVIGRIKSRSLGFRYDVPMSVIGFVVPDQFGVLGPDEIQVKSSRRNLKKEKGLDTDIVMGDVLLTRNPCKVPTDVRKVRAVEHPQLREYVDVIVCSVQGQRRLLDFLAGGDYDGDTAMVIWAPEFVAPFTNADTKYSEEPPGVKQCFSSKNEGVEDFLKRVDGKAEEHKIAEMLPFLLGALHDTSVVGKYSMMHDIAIYTLGYSHPRTIRLAYVFCKVLDSSKTGLRILPATLSSDLAKYNHPRGPKWKDQQDDKKRGGSEKKGEKYEKSNMSYLKRPGMGSHIKGPFIMDVLREAAKRERDRALVEMDKLFSQNGFLPDPHLTQPWLDAVEMAECGSQEAIKRKKKDLGKISLHVQFMYQEHKTDVATSGASFTNLAIEVRQDVLRALSKKFAASPHLKELDSIMDDTTISRLRASYAYLHDCDRNSTLGGWSRFPWNMAMRDLCTIKATALGPYKTVTNGFYERFRMSKRHV